MSRGVKRDIGKVILKTVGVAGVLSVAIFAPHVIGAMGQMGMLGGRKRQKEIIGRSCKSLVSRGLLSVDSSRNIKLTKKGLDMYREIELCEYRINPPKRGWDGKWRVVIFDIPEKRRSTRDAVRGILISAGFRKLQDSVWVHPYECQDFVTLMKTDMYLSKNILYMTVDEIENSGHLRRDFDLN
jgi:DNA-binding transcriptional regulator PaaX